jgi:excisionase family DNA binding protein
MLTTAQAAAELNCSIDTVRRLCRSGRLPYVRLGREIRIPREALRMLDERPADDDAVIADAARLVAEAVQAGRLPAETPPEVIGLVTSILRDHYREAANS